MRLTGSGTGHRNYPRSAGGYVIHSSRLVDVIVVSVLYPFLVRFSRIGIVSPSVPVANS